MAFVSDMKPRASKAIRNGTPMLRSQAELKGTMAAMPMRRRGPRLAGAEVRERRDRTAGLAARLRLRRFVEASPQHERIEQCQRRHEQQCSEPECDDRRDDDRASGRGLLDRESGQGTRTLRKPPARNDRRDSGRCRHPRGLVAPAQHERDRAPPRPLDDRVRVAQALRARADDGSDGCRGDNCVGACATSAIPARTLEREAAAGRSVIVATIVALGLGALLLVPSLALLYALVLRGRLTKRGGGAGQRVPVVRSRRCANFGFCGRGRLPRRRRRGRGPFDSAWGRIIGVPLLMAFVALGFVSLATAMQSWAESG